MACLGRAFHAADAELNTTYTRSLQALLPADRKRLVEVERIWVRYRGASCGAERDLFETGEDGETTIVQFTFAKNSRDVRIFQRARAAILFRQKDTS